MSKLPKKLTETAKPQGVALRTEFRNVEQIKPYSKNPRKNEKTIQALKKSIQTFGWMRPIGVDADSVIVFGHSAYAAALELGLSEVPVVVLAHLAPEQIRAYRIADNGTGQIVRFDEGLLLGEMDTLADFGADNLSFYQRIHQSIL